MTKKVKFMYYKYFLVTKLQINKKNKRKGTSMKKIFGP